MTDATPAPNDATDVTRAVNAAALMSLPLPDNQDFEDARRGFIGSVPDGMIKTPDGKLVWSLADYAFLDAEQAPPTVHPSLWRQARLNLNMACSKSPTAFTRCV